MVVISTTAHSKNLQSTINFEIAADSLIETVSQLARLKWSKLLITMALILNVMTMKEDSVDTVGCRCGDPLATKVLGLCGFMRNLF